MKNIIAFAGKGGTGKTTLSALFIKELAEKTNKLLAIDADPNSNLYQALGAEEHDSVMDIVEEIGEHKGKIPSGFTKDRYIEMRVQEALQENDRYDLLSMGRPEGPGCYCYANNLLRDMIAKLVKSYEVIIIDNEAGMEHLSRRLMRKIDYLFVVSDYSRVGIRSAGNIDRLTESLGLSVARKYLVINKAAGGMDTLNNEIEALKFDNISVIPLDENLIEAAVKGEPVVKLKDDSPAIMAVRNTIKDIEKSTKEYAWKS